MLFCEQEINGLLISFFFNIKDVVVNGEGIEGGTVDKQKMVFFLKGRYGVEFSDSLATFSASYTSSNLRCLSFNTGLI